jgi:hypothetical protein
MPGSAMNHSGKASANLAIVGQSCRHRIPPKAALPTARTAYRCAIIQQKTRRRTRPRTKNSHPKRLSSISKNAKRIARTGARPRSVRYVCHFRKTVSGARGRAIFRVPYGILCLRVYHIGDIVYHIVTSPRHARNAYKHVRRIPASIANAPQKAGHPAGRSKATDDGTAKGWPPWEK